MKRALPSEPPPSLVAYEMEPGRVMFVHALPEMSCVVPGLGKAEQEVLALLLRGHDTSSIAEHRRTSPRTVSHQVASLFRKFGVSSRAELAVKVLELAEVCHPFA